MKNDKKPDDLAAEEWLDGLLSAPPEGAEIGADHHAMDAAGLRPPDTGALYKTGSIPVQESPAPAPAFEMAGSLEPFYDDEFRNTFGEGSELAQIIDEVNQQSAVTEEPASNTHRTPPVPVPPVAEPAPSPAPRPRTASKNGKNGKKSGAKKKNTSARKPAPAAPAAPVPAPVPVPVAPPAPVPQTPVNDKPQTPAKASEVKARKAAPERKHKTAAAEAPVDESKKGRPKRKKGYGLFGLPHLLSTCIWLGIILMIGVTAGRLIWLCATDVLAFGREPIAATVVVEETDTIEDVAVKLQEAGLIRYTELFKFYADLSNAQEEIRPGTYEFNKQDKDSELVVYDYMALVSVMSPSSGLTVVEDLRIPEGFTCAQIFQLLEENKVCTVKELEEYCISGELSEYWFLEGVERGHRYCLEGYLFPNTYDFYENDDPKRVLEKMLNAFDANFTDQMRDDLNVLNDKLEAMWKANGYGDDYIQENRITIREATIIASMIEKETANNVESFTISSVIYNRITNAGKYPFLNIDATLVYALDGKADLTEDDKKLDTPYNTYLYKGLPPGPISNPSQNSLAAALQPEDTDFHYYAYNPATQEHQFSNSYEEHLAFLESLKTGAATQTEETDE